MRPGRKITQKIAISLSDPNIVKAFKTRLTEWMLDPIDYLFCNYEEAKTFCSSSDLEVIRKKLLHSAKNIFITLGSEGAYVISSKTIETINGYPAKAIDTNGAGDMFAGGTLNLMTKGQTLKDAARFGCFLSLKRSRKYWPKIASRKIFRDL